MLYINRQLMPFLWKVHFVHFDSHRKETLHNALKNIQSEVSPVCIYVNMNVLLYFKGVKIISDVFGSNIYIKRMIIIMIRISEGVCLS